MGGDYSERGLEPMTNQYLGSIGPVWRMFFMACMALLVVGWAIGKRYQKGKDE